MNRWIVALLLYLVLASGALAETDRQKFCQPNANEVMLIIDVTSELDARARDLLEDGVEELVAGLDPGESISITTLTDQVTTREVLLEGCVPYCASDLGTVLLDNCTEGLLRVEDRRLRRAIGAALRNRLSVTRELPGSDIIRTINAAVSARDEARRLELYLFSDLIENSALISAKLLWSTPPGDLLELVAKQRLLPDLTNASVHAFGLGRRGVGAREALPQAQMLTLESFWRAYFAAAGTEEVTLSEFLER